MTVIGCCDAGAVDGLIGVATFGSKQREGVRMRDAHEVDEVAASQADASGQHAAYMLVSAASEEA